MSFCTTEQHVDYRVRRVARDNRDVDKFIARFMYQNPFSSGEYGMGLSIGVISDEKIDYHLVNEVEVANIQSNLSS